MCVSGKNILRRLLDKSARAGARIRSWHARTAHLFCIATAMLAGCSVYPIPDDVLGIRTEDIVRHARCEMRTAIIDWIIAEKLRGASEKQVVEYVLALQKQVSFWQNENNRVAPRKPLYDIDKLLKDEPAKSIYKYMQVAVVYSFDFNITEENKAGADVAFKLPFTSPAVFDLDSATSLHLTRQGQRQFTAADRWVGMIVNADRCKDVLPRRRNLVYPLDGSIGIGRVVDTFIDISEQGGAKNNFVDTLIFTTELSAGGNATVKLNPVPHSFRLVSAGAHLNKSRTDAHKMIMSMAFPHADSPEAITGVERYDGDLNAPFLRPAPWRARYNLCVADARDRENTFKALRLTAPEVYCITYADQFAPQYGPPDVVETKAVRRQEVVPRRGPIERPNNRPTAF